MYIRLCGKASFWQEREQKRRRTEDWASEHYIYNVVKKIEDKYRLCDNALCTSFVFVNMPMMFFTLSFSFVSNYCKLPVLNLLTGQKSVFSPRRGDSLHRFSRQIWHGRQASGSAWLCKISLQLALGGWECGPKISKIFTFW